MHKVILSLGSNLGNKKYYIKAMENKIKKILGDPFYSSRLMKTEPLETSGNQPWFYNKIISGTYNGSPHELLNVCLKIEKQLGRTNKSNKLPRTADIDILFFGDIIIYEKDLIIPHPQILKRRFCIEGLYEIEPNFKIPGTNQTIFNFYKNMQNDIRKQKIFFI
jgi:2-amino-4-hydroxy-6-hydroxymethyldihydropteridine diphosphokinase